MMFHENRLQTILMKYHTLFFSKIWKDVENVSSVAVVIGALRVNITMTLPAIDVQLFIFYRSHGLVCGM